MAENTVQQTSIDAFLAFADQQGWVITDERRNGNDRQFVIREEETSENAAFVIFSVHGKIVPQGKEGSVLTQIQAWVETWQNQQETLSAFVAASTSTQQPTPLNEAVSPTNNVLIGKQEVPAQPLQFTHLPLTQVEQSALAWINKHLGQRVYEFLSVPNRNLYFSGVERLLFNKEYRAPFSDYSILVVPFARAYEGFLIQLAAQLDIISQKKLLTHTGPLPVEEYLQCIKKKLMKKDKVRYLGLIQTLQSAWSDIHHSVIHYDPFSPTRHQHLLTAEQDITVINRAMRRGYEYLIECGILKETALSLHPPPMIVKEQTVEIAPQRLRPTPTPTPVVTILRPKATGKARIGLDESGKSDYFGPLVIGAVYIDEQTEGRLLALGVRDSKSLSDSRNLELAVEIKRLCPYHSVVSIEPKQLNAMYKVLQNENKVLAWGHARCLENVLEKRACSLAIADQFGDVSLLKNALLEKSRLITLEQRPRAEEDVAVAAASILARAEFLCQMEILSFEIGITLPKGPKPELIRPIGRQIVTRYGEQRLSTVAKTYVKTTKEILQSD